MMTDEKITKIMAILRQINGDIDAKFGEDADAPHVTLMTDGLTGTVLFLGEALIIGPDVHDVKKLEKRIRNNLKEVLRYLVYFAEDYLDEEFIKYEED